ncbi:unnamed protein product [Cylicocyclus nassatus]|uniref:Cystatin domain-containing protein n=1 Tax=Cylicocyclus nassatus TaxID=53992 RepID=A0AA36DKR2_CYLNA|nr:unnamed protein product [Cylicocyclus nassatus]
MYIIAAFVVIYAVVFTHEAMMTGGKHDQDPIKPEYMEIAWKAAETLNEDAALNSGSHAMLPVEVLKAQTQVVAGVIYELEVLYGESNCTKDNVSLVKLKTNDCKVMDEGRRTIYKIRYYVIPWQNYEKIEVSKVKDTVTATMAGGGQEDDPSRSKYMDIAWKAAKTLNENYGANPGPYAMMPIRVLKAQTHVVSGVIYDLEVLYGESGCRKDEVDLSKLKMANCGVMNKGMAVYKIHYFAKPWKNYEQIQVSKVKDMTTGRKQDQDPSSPEYMDIAWKATKMLNEDSAATASYVMIPMRVVMAKSQVVDGIIYDLRILYGESNCKKNKVDLVNLRTANCRVMLRGKRAVYKIHYYAKPWQNYEQIKVSKMKLSSKAGFNLD